MGLLIEVNTATLTSTEAAALTALLAVIHPGSVQASALDKATTALATGSVAVVESPAGLADALIAAESARVAKLDPAPDPTPAPVVPVRVAPNGVEVDAEGLPWDVRIHSSSKGKLANGTWKIARNTPAEKVTAVKAELRAALGAPAIPVGTAAPAPAPAPTGIVPIPPAPGTAAPAPAPLAIQVDNGPAPAPAGAPPASAYATCTFADAMGRVVDLTVAGVSMDAINAAVATVGLTQPRDLALRPDLVPAAMAAMATLGA